MLKSFFEKGSRWVKGFAVFVRITRNNNAVFVLNNQHIGDICYSLALLQSYRNQHGKVNIQVIWNGKYAFLYKAFGVDSLYQLSSEEQVYLLAFLSNSFPTLRERIRKRFIVTYTSYYMSGGEMEVQNISVMQLLAKHAYCLKDTNEITYPVIEKTDLKNVVEQYGIKKGKTVVINPNALSMKMPTEIFQYIADTLKRRGYCIITNLSSADDKPLAGTEGVWLSLTDMYQLAEYCGCVVGVRSGFFDFLISGHCEFLVLYPEDYFMRESYKLTEWKTLNCMEFTINAENWMEISDAIISRIERML